MNKLFLFTICLDAMPFITWHLPMLNRLVGIDWHWIIAEGASQNIKDTAWCKPQTPRLSRDGSSEYLTSLQDHPRITVLRKENWAGKVEMVNACLSKITQPGLLLQVDSDEIWNEKQLETLMDLFSLRPEWSKAYFFCRYFVGQNILTVGENVYGNHQGEWLRAWRFTPGDTFLTHEPPGLCQQFSGFSITRNQTREYGLVFDHYSWVFPSQVQYKEQFYGYAGALDQWRALQRNKKWPVNLKDFLPWVTEGTTADLLHK